MPIPDEDTMCSRLAGWAGLAHWVTKREVPFAGGRVDILLRKPGFDLPGPKALLLRVWGLGLELEFLDNGKMRLRGPGPRPPQELFDRLKYHREGLIDIISTLPAPTVDQELQRDERGWIFLGQAIGECVVCDELCRSWDPDDRPLHPTCKATS